MAGFLWNALAFSGNLVFMRSLVIAIVFLLFTNGALVASTHSAQTADAVGQMMTVQGLPDAAAIHCCENTGSKMGHGHISCAMDCHYLVPYVAAGFPRTISVKASSYSASLIFSVEGSLMRPPIVS
ncbi:MAG: hypothetical protein ACSHXI_14580 [Hoeflea sp.]|uniref:hypothetical protein n=1 Tax=Hoeflea sp. TaxID=1940281 RepID=UPI003EFB38C6